MLSMVHRGAANANKADKIDVKREGETTLSGSMTRQVRPHLSISTVMQVPGLRFRGCVDGAGSSITRPDITYYEHWQDDRGDGNQDAKSSARGLHVLPVLLYYILIPRIAT